MNLEAEHFGDFACNILCRENTVLEGTILKKSASSALIEETILNYNSGNCTWGQSRGKLVDTGW